MQRKYILTGAIIAGVVVSALLILLVARSMLFRITNTNPRNGAVTPLNGALIIRASKSITNADEIIKSLVTEPAVRLDITVKDDTITIYPFDGFSPEEYVVIIPVIRHQDQSIDNFRLSFTAQDIPVDELTSDQQSSLQIGQTDIEDVAVAKYPFLADIVTNQDDFDIDYELTNDLLIKINLHPKDLPPMSDSDGMVSVYKNVRDASLAFIRSQRVDPKNLNLEFTPRFIDQEYRAQNPPPTSDNEYTGDGVPPEQQ